MSEPFTIVVHMEREQCRASISVAATPLAECREAQRFFMGQSTDGGAWVCGYGRTPEDAAQAALAEFGRAALAYFRHRKEPEVHIPGGEPPCDPSNPDKQHDWMLCADVDGRYERCVACNLNRFPRGTDSYTYTKTENWKPEMAR